MSERVVKVFSDDIEIGSIPYKEYEIIYKYANSKMNRFLSRVSFFSCNVRKITKNFFKFFKFISIASVAIFLLFSHPNIPELLDSFRSASSVKIVQQFYFILEFIVNLSIVFTFTDLALSSNKGSGGSINYVDRSMKRKIAKVLETPCYGSMEIKLEGNDEKL